MADATELQECEEEAPLFFKTYVLNLDATFAFRSDICLNGKSQVPEEFYIGSNPDEEIVCMSKPQLQLLRDESLALSMQTLALTTIIRNGSHERVQPLKAPLDEVHKLTIDSIKCYIATFKKTPIVYSGYIDKFMLMQSLEYQGDLFEEERRDGEATLLIPTKLLLLLTIIVVVVV